MRRHWGVYVCSTLHTRGWQPCHYDALTTKAGPPQTFTCLTRGAGTFVLVVVVVVAGTRFHSILQSIKPLLYHQCVRVCVHCTRKDSVPEDFYKASPIINACCSLIVPPDGGWFFLFSSRVRAVNHFSKTGGPPFPLSFRSCSVSWSDRRRHVYLSSFSLSLTPTRIVSVCVCAWGTKQRHQHSSKQSGIVRQVEREREGFCSCVSVGQKPLDKPSIEAHPWDPK